MAKRPQPDNADEQDESTSNKKLRRASLDSVSEPLAALRTHAKDLIRCLKPLRKPEDAPSDDQLELLISLSKTLLPVFQSLANNESGSRHETAEPGLGASKLAAPAATTERPAIGALPPLGSITAWMPDDIPESLPRLPALTDPVLAKAALTHKGLNNGNSDQNYEVLEFLGDAFICHASSEFIMQTFPHLSPGRASQLRERLVRNSTLAQYTLQYGLDKRAFLPPEFSQEVRSGGSRVKDHEREKVMGDLFEAYIGALIRSGPDGVTRTLNWLKPLWSMNISKEIRAEYRRDASLNPSVPPKVRLSQAILCPGVKIRYDDMPGKAKVDKNNNLPLCTVGVYVDAWGKSELLAQASALSRKDAGNKAAELALANRKRVQFYIDKKKALYAAREMQEEAGI